VISDIMMPQVDGYQFLKQVQTPVSRPCQWCFNRQGMTDRIQGYQAGVDAYCLSRLIQMS